MAGEKGNANKQLLLESIYQAVCTAIGGLLANASTPLENLYVSLHTADPTANGTQASNEAAYPGYARVSVPRNPSGWSVTGGTVYNLGPVTFPFCTGGEETEAFVAIGTAPSGPGSLLWIGPLAAPLKVSQGITPGFLPGQLQITEG